MLGTLINAALILAGTAVGLLLRRGLPERVKHAILMAMGLSTVLIGLMGAVKTTDTLGVILCMAVGTLLGSLIDLERQLDRLGHWVEHRLGQAAGEGVSRAFVSTSLIYCVGAMAVVGSIDSGIRGDHTTLIAKGIIDGVTAIVFASTMGIGVGLSAVSVFVYQGTIALLAGLLSPVLTDAVVTEMSAVGGLLIAGIGLNLIYDKRIPVGNMLPAIFLPLAYLPLRALFG